MEFESCDSGYIGVIAGDLNARTAGRPDYINDEGDINNHVGYLPVGSSVVDYVMSCDLKYISDFEILPPTIYSDHSQVKFRCTPLVKYMTRQFNVVKKLWEEWKALELTNERKNMENEFIDVFKTDIDYSAEDVDRMVKTHVIYKVYEPLLDKTFHTSNHIKHHNVSARLDDREVFGTSCDLFSF